MTKTKPVEPANKFSVLGNKVYKTAQDRFQADKRLKAHAAWSTWTIALTSIVLISINLLDGFGVIGYYSQVQIDIAQVMASVFILVYSLLLTTRDDKLNALKMHQCGLELSSLYNQIAKFSSEGGSDDDYTHNSELYAEILKGYDNHKLVDHRKRELEDSEECANLGRSEKIKTHAMSISGFLHYFVVIALGLFVLWCFASNYKVPV